MTPALQEAKPATELWRKLEIKPMSNDEKRKEVEELIDKAAQALKSEDALRFSQAACNVANAMCAIKTAQGKPIGG